jgi:hypothetical protein
MVIWRIIRPPAEGGRFRGIRHGESDADNWITAYFTLIYL